MLSKAAQPAIGRSRLRGGVPHQVVRLLASRLGQAAGTAVVLATLCFALVHALPGDTALRIAAAQMGDDRLTPEVADRIRVEEGLDRPLLHQYAAWMGRLARGDLGRSLITRKPVTQELEQRIRVSLPLAGLGWLLSYVLALPLGFAAGFWPGG